jgi:predicted nuclease of restriction endonuclease-like RecB superfamily
MISSDLLRYKLDNKSHKIHPILCSLEQNSKDIEIAKQVIQVFEYTYQHSIIKEKLNQSLKGLEQTYKDYKLIRGLAAVIEKRCTFKSISQVHSKDFHLNDSKQSVEIFKNFSAMDIRRNVFDESARQNIALGEQTRKSILEKISNKLGVTNEMLSKMMWSDLDENMMIDTFIPVSAEKLLLFYNISLIQTLLFSCIKIRIGLGSRLNLGTRWKEVLREVKRLGLMYWLDVVDETTQESRENTIVCSIEGALNVIKLSDRYGSAISKIIPNIIKSERWYLQADILRVTNNGRKLIYEFEISEKSYPESLPSNKTIRMHFEDPFYQDNESKKDPLPMNNQSHSEYDSKDRKDLNTQGINFENFTDNSNVSMLFDSKIEKIFLQKFELFKTGWTIEREPEPIITKQKTAFIPDFVLSKFDNRIFVEIIGFWTKEYLERKLTKIFEIIQKKTHDEKFFMILVINLENLMSYELNEEDKITHIKNNRNVLITSYKKDKILFKEILKYIKEIENIYISDNVLTAQNQSKIFRNMISLTEEFKKSETSYLYLGTLDEMLKRYCTNGDAFLKVSLKELIENNNEFKCTFERELSKKRLLMIEDYILKWQFIEKIWKDIKNVINLGEASKILDSEKIPEKIHISLLTSLGFHIEWNGLDYSKAKMILKKNSTLPI